MRRTIPRFLMAATVALTIAACGGSGAPVATQPTPTVTDTFPGNLTINGAATFSFDVKGAGTVTATLTTVAPDNQVALSFSVGNWNATANTCTAVVSNDGAIQGAVLTGQVSAAGSLCVRVSDVGRLVEAASFVVTVVHP